MKKGKYITTKDKAKVYYEATYRISEKNHCVFFIHGLGGDLTAWNKEREYFESENVSSIAIDLRGHGYSDRSDREGFYKFPNFVSDIQQIMREEKFKKYSVVGHCFGGMISIIMESQNPKSVENLILVDTGYKPPLLIEPIFKNKLLLQVLKTFVNLIPDFRSHGHINFDKYVDTEDIDFRRLASDILHVSLKNYLLISENLFGYDATHLLEKISVPTLVVEGTNDTIFPPRVARHLKKRIKNSEIDFIEGANHILVINNPIDLAREVERFLIKRKFI